MLARVSLVSGLVQFLVFWFALRGGEVPSPLDVLGEEFLRLVGVVV